MNKEIWWALLQVAVEAIENNPHNRWWKEHKEVWDSWEALKKSFWDMAADGRFTIWELYDCYQKGEEFDRWLQEYKPKPEPKHYPYEWVRGILTLNPIPSVKQIKDMGFNVLLPFGYRLDSQKLFIKDFASTGGKIIMPVNADINIPEESILGYLLSPDEPDCRQISLIDMNAKLQVAKETFKKPIACELSGRSIGCGFGKQKEWINFINKLDFVVLTCYPYALNIPVGKEIDEMKRCVEKEWQGINVPIIPILQAHSGGIDHKWNLREPNPKEQVDFWKEMGYIVYPWFDGIDGVIKHKEEWKNAITSN